MAISDLVSFEDVDPLELIWPMRMVINWPEPGERRDAWADKVWFGYGEGDDGGGAALAGYRYGLCAFPTL